MSERSCLCEGYVKPFSKHNIEKFVKTGNT